MVNADLHYLNLVEVESIAPLDRQFGVHPRLSVPDVLRPYLFEAPAPSDAEIALYGTISAIPPMQTYLVADAQAFPDWDSLRQNLDVPNRCLFTGEAEQNLGHLAPYLVELAEEDDFTRRLLTFLDDIDEHSAMHHWHRPFGLILRSREGFDAVFNHLRRFTKLQDEAGKWHFRRFWDARHSYHWLPLLKTYLPVAARFFGCTQAQSTAVLHSISVLDGPRARMLIARWNNDAFIAPSDRARLPVSRQQPLDVDYRLLLDRATRARSLDKVVDYLIRTYPQRFGKNHLARKDVEEFARDCREIGLRLGASTELGWTRIATIATHLGIGFLDDARFSRRGLSYARIGHDSQGGKILTVGRECAKPVIAVRNRLTDDAVRREVQKRHAVEWPALEDLLGLLDRIDPDCRQIWGEDALIDWVRQFLAAPRPFESFGRSLTVQLATAYCHGNYFRHDPSLAYCHALAAPSLDDYDQAIAAAFESEFRKS